MAYKDSWDTVPILQQQIIPLYGGRVKVTRPAVKVRDMSGKYSREAAGALKNQQDNWILLQRTQNRVEVKP